MYIPKAGQNKNEERKNLKVYSALAKYRGEKYALLPVDDTPGKKNPDAVNMKTYYLSDAKSPVSRSIKNAVQNSIKEASAQKVGEVVIQLNQESNPDEIRKGLIAAFQQGRAKTIKKVIIIDAKGEIQEFGREMFK